MFQHGPLLTRGDAVVLRHHIGKCGLQASPLSQRSLDEVFHDARKRLGAQGCGVLWLPGVSPLSCTNVNKGFLAITTARLISVIPLIPCPQMLLNSDPAAPATAASAPARVGRIPAWRGTRWF